VLTPNDKIQVRTISKGNRTESNNNTTMVVNATEIRGTAKSTIKGITSAISMFDNSFLKNEGMLSKYPYGSFNSLPPEIACNKCVYLDFLGYMTKATQPNGKPHIPMARSPNIVGS